MKSPVLALYPRRRVISGCVLVGLLSLLWLATRPAVGASLFLTWYSGGRFVMVDSCSGVIILTVLRRPDESVYYTFQYWDLHALAAAGFGPPDQWEIANDMIVTGAVAHRAFEWPNLGFHFYRHQQPVVKPNTLTQMQLPAARGWQLQVPYWFLVSACAALLVVLPHRRWIAQRRRLRQGRCPLCGYDLRATPDRCPECGTAVPESHKPEVTPGPSAGNA